MKIAELKIGQGKIDIELLIKSKGEIRSFNKYGQELKVCNTVASDDSGEIKLSLWNADIDKINQGDTIKINNGYVSDFNGEKQLSAGKYGKIEVVKAGAGQATEQTQSPAAEEPSEKKAEVKKTKTKKKEEDFEETEF